MDLLASLSSLLGDESRVSRGVEEIERHSRGYDYHPPHPPDAVVYPKNREEVVDLVRFANGTGVPIVPFGQGSSLEGHVVPVHGGVSLDTCLMNRILEFRPEDFVARVQPGVTRLQLNEELAESGLFFSPDPGWDASLGGMAATNAGGSNALRYGVMRDQVLGIEVVLGDGTVMRTGGMSMKSVAGYDLTALLVGSEGTLGVFTELTVRLRPLPNKILAARAIFEDIESAGRAAVAILRSGLQANRAELVDRRTVEAVNLHRGTSYPEAPSLFLEFSGSGRAIEDEVAQVRELASSYGSKKFDSEAELAERQRLWEARHMAAIAVGALSPDKGQLSTDVCVPVSLLPEALEAARQTMREHDLDGAVLGHAGDGNYHVLFPVDPNDTAELVAAQRVSQEIVSYALSVGGTCTGEHGVGLGKIDYLRQEHGDSLTFMRQIKDAADPVGIMNPGKNFAG